MQLEKKIFTFLLLTFRCLPASTWGQQTKTLYSPVTWKKCTQTLDTVMLWKVKNISSGYVKQIIGSTAEVSPDSSYEVSCDPFCTSTSRINPEDWPKTSDTLGYDISLFVYRPAQNWVPKKETHHYCYINALAEGYLEEHYLNGQLAFSGTFKEGKVIDTLRWFTPDGVLKEVTIPNGEGEHQIEYYPSGQVKWHFNTLLFSVHYHENGNLKSYHSWNKKGKTTESKDYHPNGALRRVRKGNRVKHYYETGELESKGGKRKKRFYTKSGKVKTVLKRKFEDKILNKKEYEFHWTFYDHASGKKHFEIEMYDNWPFNVLPNSINDFFEEYTDYYSATSFKDGRPHQKVDFFYEKEEEPWGNKEVWYLFSWDKPSKSWKKERKVSKDFTRNFILSAIENN